MSIRVCVYIYITYEYQYVYMYIIYIYTCIYVQRKRHMCAHIHIYIHIFNYIYTYICIKTYDTSSDAYQVTYKLQRQFCQDPRPTRSVVDTNHTGGLRDDSGICTTTYPADRLHRPTCIAIVQRFTCKQNIDFVFKQMDV